MNHQKLECYKRLLKLVSDLQADMPNWPRGTFDLKDQLRRALNSAVLNLVEGNGRYGVKDRKCFFNRATASLAEASACLELHSVYVPAQKTQSEARRAEMGIIYAMIRHLP